MSYAWLNDSLLAIKTYHYFEIISNTEAEGSLLISYCKKKRLIINILRSSKRCYKVCYTFVSPSVPVMLQEFKTFPTVSALCDWLKEVMETQLKDVPPKRLDIENFGYLSKYK